MIMEATTVKPDLRKGLFRLLRGEGFLRVQWKERSLDVPEDDILVFPFEANFLKVQQSHGRVYILKFKHDDRKYFFWMQEPNEKQDAGICQTIDFFLNCDPQESDEEEEEQAELAEPSVEAPKSFEPSNMEVERVGNSTATTLPSTSTDGIPQGAVQLQDLQRILRSIAPVADMAGSGALMPHDAGPSLADVLKPELVAPLLRDSQIDERLVELLPEGCWTPEAIIELMQSPQFHQQVDSFTHVLRSGQIDLSQFGIDPSKYNYTVLSFLEAIEDQVAKKSATIFSLTSEEAELNTPNESSHSNRDHDNDNHMDSAS
ncbi:hypothetical protein KP509_29G052500 [Ceratopteris richardii]|nr:hypothetical protein KP509_29G052500 [Ceratopteris richardii]